LAWFRLYMCGMSNEANNGGEMMNTNTEVTLTEHSHLLFIELANDAGNWSGTPLFGGNVGDEVSDKGNLTDLKKKGLVTTFEDEGCSWVVFTEVGKAYAAENGVDLSWID